MISVLHGGGVVPQVIGHNIIGYFHFQDKRMVKRSIRGLFSFPCPSGEEWKIPVSHEGENRMKSKGPNRELLSSPQGEAMAGSGSDQNTGNYMKSASPSCCCFSSPNVDVIARSRTSTRCFVYSETLYFRQISRDISRYFFTEPS